MTEGTEDFSAGPPGSAVDTGHVPKEKPEETEAGGENGEEVAEVTTAAGGGGDGDDGGGDGEHPGAVGVVALPGTCCVCIQMEHVNNCLHSEKICILPILACLLSLALCTAGLKWVFADKIFEYEAPTHLDPKRIGQDPMIISVDPTLGISVSFPRSSPSTISLTTASNARSSQHPELFMQDTTTAGSYVPPQGTLSEPSGTLKPTTELPTIPKQTPLPLTTQEVNHIVIPTISSTSSTTARVKTSSHVTRCSESQKNYCVNGGECFTLELIPGSTKFLCRQQRKKLHDRLRQNLRKKRNKLAKSTSRRQVSNLPLQDLQQNNQCNGAVQHAAEKETETTFSTSKYALSTQEPTTLTHISSQSPLATSPPSEMSAPLSSLATSVPSVAVSPFEEKRPLLLTKTRQPLQSLKQDELKSTCAHYNHGHEAHSLPPSPLCARGNENYHVAVTAAASHTISASTEMLVNANNMINNYSATGAAVTNGHALHHKESSIDSILESETEILKGDQIPFFSRDNTKALLFRVKDSSRTKVVSPNDDLQLMSSTKPDARAV
ncbi:pro-neuregulin-1, membrane-bound isoform isoform X4 [Dunckerocampus dactyliophorus]|uniref:pro-neuregulin-1, membrane-bound isoform isoform X4 n=1 Tax=Dunckerocampus dactyliophorus TaxID=161453 RepID=UPI0024051CC4|nr:pro-neuregulin-1, membrane-bound isoform isoform X4 [Dunckerocampus dactyliophorus]